MQLLITLGYLASPLFLSRLDCKFINMIFLSTTAAAMLGLGLSFLHPDSLGFYLSLPCLVVAGASYGLGVGPVPFILMSSLFTQRKSFKQRFTENAPARAFSWLKASTTSYFGN